MRTSRIFILALTAGLLFSLGFAYWYMMLCAGDWQGTPLEVTMSDDLTGIEDLLRADVFYLSETLGPRNPAHYASLLKAAEWITERWRAQDYEVKAQTFQVEGKECANLEIEIPGRRKQSEIVILSAQYDTSPSSPGANNNASGVVVLLQLSDMLQSHKPDRTLRLVNFVTQQSPYSNTDAMGSLRYARRCRERGENIRVMLSMDSIGIYKEDPNTQKLPFPFSLFYPDRGNFLAFIADLGTRSYVIEATRGFKKGSAFPIEAGSVPRWVKGASWSDHGSFWHYNYRAIQVTDTGAFRAASHTTPDDTIEKIDFAALARITIGMYMSILELTTIAGV